MLFPGPTWGHLLRTSVFSLHSCGPGESVQVKVKVAQSCLTLCDSMVYTVHGILQARILEWVAVPFFRESSQPRDGTQVSHVADGRGFSVADTNVATRGSISPCSSCVFCFGLAFIFYWSRVDFQWCVCFRYRTWFCYTWTYICFGGRRSFPI